MFIYGDLLKIFETKMKVFYKKGSKETTFWAVYRYCYLGKKLNVNTRKKLLLSHTLQASAFILVVSDELLTIITIDGCAYKSIEVYGWYCVTSMHM